MVLDRWVYFKLNLPIELVCRADVTDEIQEKQTSINNLFDFYFFLKQVLSHYQLDFPILRHSSHSRQSKRNTLFKIIHIFLRESEIENHKLVEPYSTDELPLVQLYPARSAL